jgi:ectoine hydroxylase-related dioxygenase (phytanoyl-CoA dioxygenase family)
MLHDLQEKGYAICDALTAEECAHVRELHQEWYKAEGHTLQRKHGIYKELAGHQRFVWWAKTRPKIRELFAEIWGTMDLVSGFDGACYFSGEEKHRDTCWTHTDQAPDTTGLKCIQGGIALTENKERTLVVYEGSHLLWEPYMRERKLTGTKNWLKIDPTYLATIQDRKRVLHIKEGQMVFWDSRTFHQNQNGKGSEERLFIYACMLPRNDPENTKKQNEKRKKYFLERRTTSHWPYPIHVNAKQPSTYGDESKKIDYSKVIPPDLDDLEEEIMKLI